MRYDVVVKKRAYKMFFKLPKKAQKKFEMLLNDLADFGPVLTNWRNFSKLSEDTYHCHLDYSWVACWKKEKNTITIEVYYVGSRENAPY